MNPIEAILNEIFNLGPGAESVILQALEERKALNGIVTDVTNEIKENRFSRGKSCPHCESEAVCRYGKYNGKQRYKCNKCNRTFTDFTNSPCYNSKKPLNTWIQYIKCMILGYSIKKCSKELGISIPTAFYWRHKVMDAIRKYIGIGTVEGIVEIDDTYFRENFKGWHTENSEFKMPRKAYHRGVKQDSTKEQSKTEKRKRGLSSDQISVMCAIDRIGNMIIEPISKGNVGFEAISKLFDNRIDQEAIVCTDITKSFTKFANTADVEVIQLPKDKRKAGIFHIQHVNSLHNRIKSWMAKFRGVATKYLADYMSWFKWQEFFKTDKEIIQCRNLMVHSHTTHINSKVNDFVSRRVSF